MTLYRVSVKNKNSFVRKYHWANGVTDIKQLASKKYKPDNIISIVPLFTQEEVLEVKKSIANIRR